VRGQQRGRRFWSMTMCAMLLIVLLIWMAAVGLVSLRHSECECRWSTWSMRRSAALAAPLHTNPTLPRWMAQLAAVKPTRSALTRHSRPAVASS
jgi:hypothetical protein